MNIITKKELSKEAYLPHTDKLPKVVVDYVRNNLLKDEDEKGKALFFIIRNETELCLRKNEGYAPISYELLKKNGYEKTIGRLVELDLVEVIDFIKKVRCRRYRLKLDIYYSLNNITPNRAETYTHKGFMLYNGITNKVIRESSKERKHDIYKYNKRLKKEELIVSEVVAQSINPITHCLINYLLVEEYLDFQKERCNLGLLTEKERLRYLNDEGCYKAILERPFSVCKLDCNFKGLLVYMPRYQAQSSGRVNEIGGALNSCSREMKELALKYVPNTKNYDLKSSQIYGLKYQLMSANLNDKVLDKYFAIDKKEMAKEVGIDVDTWKGINYGAYFGGFPVKKLKALRNKTEKIDIKTIYCLLNYKVVYKHICNYLDIEVKFDNQRNRRRLCGTIKENYTNLLKILKILYAFYEQNKELLDEIQTWHDYIGSKYSSSSTIYIKNGKFVSNRSDMLLDITDYRNKKLKLSPEGIRKVASHLLQGQEALFIGRLVWYSEDDEQAPYTVISSQYDGLVVVGEITDKYIVKAREETGFTYAYLEEKEYL